MRDGEEFHIIYPSNFSNTITDECAGDLPFLSVPSNDMISRNESRLPQ